MWYSHFQESRDASLAFHRLSRTPPANACESRQLAVDFALFANRKPSPNRLRSAQLSAGVEKFVDATQFFEEVVSFAFDTLSERLL